MLKGELSGMEKLAQRGASAPAIQGVTDQRVTQPRHMHAYLMRAPCQQVDVSERVPAPGTITVPTDDRPTCACRLARSYNSHPLPVSRIARDRRLNDAFGLSEVPHYECGVDLGDRTPLELTLKALKRTIVFCSDNQPRRVPVKPVHNAWAKIATDTRQVATVGQQGIDEGARPVTGTGVHHDACDLIDDNEIRILVDYVQWHHLRYQVRDLGLRQVNHDAVAQAQPLCRCRDTLVDGEVAIINQALHCRPGKRLDLASYVAVDPLTGIHYLQHDSALTTGGRT